MANNSYEKAAERGLSGSTADCTWDKKGGIHTCCGSRADWRHKENCPQVVGKDEEIGNDKWKALDSMTERDKRAYLEEMFA